MHVAFVGMTHLGLTSALAAAAKGHDVLCFDPDKKRIESLSRREAPFVEPEVERLLQAPNLQFTDHVEALHGVKLVYLAPDVPTNSEGESDLSLIGSLLDTVLQELDPESIVVILSQVPPGFCRKIAWKNLFYQVETLIFGRAIERALYPERFIVGTNGTELPALLQDYLGSYDCPILTMLYESAELSKIAINLFLVSTVSTTNTIAELCEKIGARWDEIAPALRLDKRIGKHAYLSPGLGISGGNLERDMTTFCTLADRHGSDCTVVQAWIEHSKYSAAWALRKLKEKGLAKGAKIALLGLAYKKDTSSVKNSPALALLEQLSNYSIKAYDPAVKEVFVTTNELQMVESSLEALEAADAVIVMTPWDEFSKLTLRELASRMKGKIVIDPYGVIATDSSELIHEKIGE